MKPIRTAAVLAAAALAGCSTPQVSLQVRRPPTLEMPPVKILAVAEFEPATPEDAAVARYVREQFMALLNKEGAIQAVAYEAAKEKGVKVEAVLRGRVWADFVYEKDLREPKVESDVTWEKTDKGIVYIAETRDKVSVTSYEIVKAFVNVQVNLIDLKGADEKTIAALSGGRGWRERIGGGSFNNMNLWTGRAENASKGSRDREELLRASADRALAEFVRAISPHTETIQAIIAKGGDDGAAAMIRSGKYNEAIQRLEPGLQNSNDKKRAPDFYNLGLAYEALGDPGLLDIAIMFYRRALDFEPENEVFATGIGRVEGMMRGNERLASNGGSK